MALPFLGFPSNWDSILSVILGLLIILIAYSNNINKARKNYRAPVAPYVESRMSTNQNKNDIQESNTGLDSHSNIKSDSNMNI